MAPDGGCESSKLIARGELENVSQRNLQNGIEVDRLPVNMGFKISPRQPGFASLPGISVARYGSCVHVFRMKAALLWNKCSYLEFPAENDVVWTTDGSVVRKGVWSWDYPNVPLESSTWKETNGVEINVTHWLFLEDSPESAPSLDDLP